MSKPEQVPLSNITTNGNAEGTALIQKDEPSTSSSDEHIQITSAKNNPTPDTVDTTKPSKGKQYEALDAKNPAGILSSCYNLSNTAVGAGILTLPYATAQVGWILAIILFVLCALMTAYTLHIHALVSKIYRPKSSYKVLCDATAKFLSYFVDFIIALNTFGACCAYLIIVGQLWPDIIRHFGDDYHYVLYDRRLWIGIFFVVFLLPCIYFRKLDALRYVSAFGMVCYIYITLVVLSYAIIGIESDHPDQVERGDITAVPLKPLNTFKVLPLIIFAYGCLMNIMPITNELKDCTRPRLNIIINCSMIFVFILYIIMGLSGYFTYGSNCTDNLLLAYPTDLTAFLIARILLSFCITFSYPVLFSPCRHCLASLFLCAANANKGELETWKYALLTTFIWVLTIAVSMTVTSLGLLIAVDGAIAITTMTLILPGIYYWFIKDNEELQKDPWYTFKKWSSMALTVLGCILVPFCVAMIFIEV